VLADDPSKQPNDLRAPMSEVFDTLAEKLALLQKYEARYGPLSDAGDAPSAPTTTSSTTVPTLHAPAAPKLLQQQQGQEKPYVNGV